MKVLNTKKNIYIDEYGCEYICKPYDKKNEKPQLNDIVVVPALHMFGRITNALLDNTYNISCNGGFKASCIPQYMIRVIGYADYNFKRELLKKKQHYGGV